MADASSLSRPRVQVSRRRLMAGSAAALGVWAAARLSPAALGLADPEQGATVVPFVDELPDPGGRAQVKWSEPQPWNHPTQRGSPVGHDPRPARLLPAT